MMTTNHDHHHHQQQQQNEEEDVKHERMRRSVHPFYRRPEPSVGIFNTSSLIPPRHHSESSCNNAIMMMTIRTQEEVQERYIRILKLHNQVYRKSVSSYIRRVTKGENIVTVVSGKPLQQIKAAREEEGEDEDDNNNNNKIRYVVRGVAANDYYVLTQKEFDENYDESSGTPIVACTKTVCNCNGNTTTTGDNKSKNNKKGLTKYQAYLLHKDGYREYRSKRKALAYQIKKEDMLWFHNIPEQQAMNVHHHSSSPQQQALPPAARSARSGSSTTKASITTTPAFFMAPWNEKTKVELGDYLVMTYPYDDNDKGIYPIGNILLEQSYVALSAEGEYKDLANLFRMVDKMGKKEQKEKKKEGDVRNCGDDVDIAGLWIHIRRELNNLRWNDEMRTFAEIFRLVVDDDKSTALQIAIQNNAPLDILEKLFYAAPNVLVDEDDEFERFVLSSRHTGAEQNIFHFACLHNAPTSVIETILNRLPHAATLEDKFGWLPLHFACKSEVLNKDSIKMIAKSCPGALITQTRDNGLTPLSLALHHPDIDHDVILTLTTEVALQKEDKKGLLPLHRACLIGLPVDILELLVMIHPDAIECKNGWGRTPFDCAIENVTKSSKNNGLATIKFLADAYPMALTVRNKQGMTPLILAIDDYEFTTNNSSKGQNASDADIDEFFYEVIQSLATEDSIRVTDMQGQLPLHHACAKELPEKLLEKVLDLLLYPGAASHNNSGRTPFECALENICPHAIQFLLRKDPNLVNLMCSNKKNALAFLLQRWPKPTDGHDDNKDKVKRDRIRQCFKYILNACPDEDHVDFDNELRHLDQDLCKPAFEYTLEDKGLSQHGKHNRIDIFFQTIHPKDFEDIMIVSLKKNDSDSIAWMNEQCCKKTVAFAMMMQLYLHCIWIVLFAEASARYLTGTGHNYCNFAIAIVPFAILFFIFEASQFFSYCSTGATYGYLKDLWNWLDLVTIAMVLVSASRLWKANPDEKPDAQTKQILLWTGFFMFLELISFLKKTFLPFAKFVSGTLKIFIELLPFLVSMFLVLIAFSFMFFVDRYGDDYDEEENPYSTLFNSFLTTFTAFVGGPEDAQNWLDILFGVATVVVLLNVVIAIVSSEWEKATSGAVETFWKYRLDFLQEIKFVRKISPCDPMRFFDKCCPEQASKSSKTKPRKSSSGLVYSIRFIAGLLSCGLYFPSDILAVSNDEMKENVGETAEEDASRSLEGKVDSEGTSENVQAMRDEIRHLEEKMDALARQISRLTEPSIKL